MEGLNIGAFLAGYFAVLAFGITSLVAAGLWIARRPRAARIEFAAGFLAATLILALAVLSFLAPEFRQQADTALLVVAVVSLSAAGIGQFLAALHGPRAFAGAFACAAASVALLAWPLVAGDWAGKFLGGFGRRLAELGVPALAAASLLPAAASVGIAVLCLWRQPRKWEPPPWRSPGKPASGPWPGADDK